MGIGILYRFNMVYDYAHQKMYIKSNNHFAEPFEMNMSGSVIRENGMRQTYVHYVVETSEADQGGLMKGDIIKEINGQDIAEFTHFDLVRVFQNEGETVRLTVLRNGETRRIKVTLVRLI